MPKPQFQNVPLPVDPVQLVRTAVRGVTDKIPDLKAYVAALEIDEHLKGYIASELDEITENAAELHLHDVEMPGGGFNLHLTISPVKLGAGERSTFIRSKSKSIS